MLYIFLASEEMAQMVSKYSPDQQITWGPTIRKSAVLTRVSYYICLSLTIVTTFDSLLLSSVPLQYRLPGRLSSTKKNIWEPLEIGNICPKNASAARKRRVPEQRANENCAG